MMTKHTNPETPPEGLVLPSSEKAKASTVTLLHLLQGLAGASMASSQNALQGLTLEEAVARSNMQVHARLQEALQPAEAYNTEHELSGTGQQGSGEKAEGRQ